MQGEIATKALLRFMDALCNALSNNKSVEEGVAEGRLAMQEAGSADWSLPLIYEGSTPTSADEWYNRIADRIDLWIDTPFLDRHVLSRTFYILILIVGLFSFLSILLSR